MYILVFYFCVFGRLLETFVRVLGTMHMPTKNLQPNATVQTDEASQPKLRNAPTRSSNNHALNRLVVTTSPITLQRGRNNNQPIQMSLVEAGPAPSETHFFFVGGAGRCIPKKIPPLFFRPPNRIPEVNPLP